MALKSSEASENSNFFNNYDHEINELLSHKPYSLSINDTLDQQSKHLKNHSNTSSNIVNDSNLHLFSPSSKKNKITSNTDNSIFFSNKKIQEKRKKNQRQGNRLKKNTDKLKSIFNSNKDCISNANKSIIKTYEENLNNMRSNKTDDNTNKKLEAEDEEEIQQNKNSKDSINISSNSKTFKNKKNTDPNEQELKQPVFFTSPRRERKQTPEKIKYKMANIFDKRLGNVLNLLDSPHKKKKLAPLEDLKSEEEFMLKKHSKENKKILENKHNGRSTLYQGENTQISSNNIDINNQIIANILRENGYINEAVINNGREYIEKMLQAMKKKVFFMKNIVDYIYPKVIVDKVKTMVECFNPRKATNKNYADFISTTSNEISSQYFITYGKDSDVISKGNQTSVITSNNDNEVKIYNDYKNFDHPHNNTLAVKNINYSRSILNPNTLSNKNNRSNCNGINRLDPKDYYKLNNVNNKVIPKNIAKSINFTKIIKPKKQKIKLSNENFNNFNEDVNNNYFSNYNNKASSIDIYKNTRIYKNRSIDEKNDFQPNFTNLIYHTMETENDLLGNTYSNKAQINKENKATSINNNFTKSIFEASKINENYNKGSTEYFKSTDKIMNFNICKDYKEKETDEKTKETQIAIEKENPTDGDRHHEKKEPEANFQNAFKTPKKVDFVTEYLTLSPKRYFISQKEAKRKIKLPMLQALGNSLIKKQNTNINIIQDYDENNYCNENINSVIKLVRFNPDTQNYLNSKRNGNYNINEKLDFNLLDIEYKDSDTNKPDNKPRIRVMSPMKIRNIPKFEMY